MFMKLDSQFESKRPAKQTLVDLIIAKQNQRFYSDGTTAQALATSESLCIGQLK